MEDMGITHGDKPVEEDVESAPTVGPDSALTAPAAPVRRSTRARKTKRQYQDSDSDVENKKKQGRTPQQDTQTEKKPPIKRIKLSEYPDFVGEGTSADPITIDVEPRSIWQVEETTVCKSWSTCKIVRDAVLLASFKQR